MPSRKIITTLVICLGLVISVWLIQRTPANFLKQNSVNTVSVVSFEEDTANTNADWKKLIVSLDKNPTPVENLTKNNDNEFDDTTLTAQMSRDFMSQYLLLKKGGRELTQEDINRIASNVISSPQYSKLPAPVYLAKNLRITSNNDLATLRKYKVAVNSILKNRSLQIKDNPAMILSSSIKSSDSSLLERLDIIIDASNGLIQDFLSIEVPSGAATAHLGLMNSVSNIAVVTESMKVLYNDPIKAMLGLSQYNNYTVNFQKNLSAMNSYLDQIR